MQNLLQRHGIQQTTEQFEEWLQRKQALRNQRLQQERQQSGPYQIPVVVHVVHNGEPYGTGANIIDARIHSQIEVLNNDFQRLNADAPNTPAEFQPAAGSLDIEFILAKQTPEGLPTDGIVRVNGGQASWSPFDENLNAASYWPSEDYLNIWVTNLSGSFLGYAQFPVSTLEGLEDYQDGLAPTDGVMIDYTVFGVGSSDPQYNLGRTTTHEVGHFFGLRHIWGDDNNCAGTDYVSDTPNQVDETYDCPSHPQFECSNNKMFQNYMDYTDDVCMNLFTQGQIDRMIIILEDTDVPRRNSLLSSLGLIDPLPGTIDLQLTEITNPVSVICDNTPELRFTVFNPSVEVVTDLRVKVTVNSVTEIVTVNSLSIVGSGEVTVSPISLEIGENTVAVEVTQINGKTDPNTTNNQFENGVIVLFQECEPFAIYLTPEGTYDITFELPLPETVRLDIITLMGQEVAHVTASEVTNQTFTIPIYNQSSGIYIIRVKIDNTYYTRKIYFSR